MFFFEKKHQKTFATWAKPIRQGRRQIIQKFFASFFQKRRPCLLCFVAIIARPPSATAATVQIAVQNVRNDHGHVLVTLCTRADFLQPHCAWKGSAPAHPGIVTLQITGVPPGTYAAEAYHDENDNRKLDLSFFGLPEEGMGFSRDARMMFGPPRFDAASFVVTEPAAAISFALRYHF
jgi:uncharacterized protein (DUF2141 family)